MIFQWDRRKAQANIKKHGISFELAATVFDDLRHLSILDSDASDLEERWVTIGLAGDRKTLVVVHLFRVSGREEHIRITSARKAARHERGQYEEGI